MSQLLASLYWRYGIALFSIYSQWRYQLTQKEVTNVDDNAAQNSRWSTIFIVHNSCWSTIIIVHISYQQLSHS
jgi:hypothetical protein